MRIRIGCFCAALFGLPAAARSMTVPAGCDYLVITDSLLLPQAVRLAEAHAANPAGPVRKPVVVTMGDIYHAYPAAGPKFKSLSAFLRDLGLAPDHWPKYLVLFGDASEDENSPHNRVPAMINRWRQTSGDSISVPFDEAYSQLLDSLRFDVLRPKLAIGRIPAQTLEQARTYVDKVLRYESDYPYGPGAFTYGFVADDDHQGPMLDGLQDLANHHQLVWDSLPVKPFVRRVISLEFPADAEYHKPAARDSLTSMWNSGLSRFYYVGHGHNNQLADEAVFKSPGDLDRLRPSRQFPIVAMLACTTSPFVIDSIQSLGESLLFHPDGAIAVLGGMAENYPYQNISLFQKWDDLAALGGTVGETFRRARYVDDSIVDSWWVENTLTYTLLGDPALSLRNPIFDLHPAPGSGPGRLVLEAAGSQGDSVYYQVVQVDSIPYAPLLDTANQMLRDSKYLRETIRQEGRANLGAGGNYALDLPGVPDARYAAVKIMVWNGRGMHYGHFPFAALGPLAMNASYAKHAAIGPRYELILVGNGLRIRRSGPDGIRETDLNGHRFDSR